MGQVAAPEWSSLVHLERFLVPAWKPAWMLRALLSVEDGTFHADGSTELLIIFAKTKKQSQKHGKNNS
jgi:hypothetical protein